MLSGCLSQKCNRDEMLAPTVLRYFPKKQAKQMSEGEVKGHIFRVEVATSVHGFRKLVVDFF